ncbi:hypothetical protein [Enterococcus hulanensis]|nr:hypothetical protein [Enterococcus hulanensis]
MAAFSVQTTLELDSPKKIRLVLDTWDHFGLSDTSSNNYAYHE